MPRRRVLTERELNRALLARQMLLGRVSAPLPKVLDRMGTLQAQYAPSMYIGLWTRMEGFEREQLDRALERRSVAQGTLMRATIHLVSEADYWPVAIGVRRGRREAWLSASYRKDYSASQMAKLASKLRRRLGGGTISRKEIHELLGSDSVLTNGVNMWLDLVRVPPSGTWERRRADLYAAAEHWVGPPPKIEEADGIELLVRRYFGAFGPATLPEAANWAGLHPKRLEPVLRAAQAASLRGRGRGRAARPCQGAAAGSRDPRSGQVPADLGREPARSRPARGDPAGGASIQGLQRQDPTVGADVPGRRPGRRNLELREGQGQDEAVPQARRVRPP